MARAKNIAPEKAVDAAMTCFWKHGYNALGTRQLEQETGITRFTLQKSYGGKWPLFIKALDRYLDHFEEDVCPSMRDGELETIARWFERRTEPGALVDASKYGCFLLNTVVEFADADSDVNARAARFFGMMHKGFAASLIAVQQQGQVAANFDAKAMANVLLAAAVGLNIVIRSGGSNAAGEEMASSVAALVRGWKV